MFFIYLFIYLFIYFFLGGGEGGAFLQPFYVRNMGLPEELYFAMLGVGYEAKRHKIPSLARTTIDVAEKSLAAG